VVRPIALTLFIIVSSSSVHAGTLELHVDVSGRELRTVLDGDEVRRYDIAVGKDDYPTPTGQFRIRKVIWNPSWVPPDSKWARNKSPKPPGHPQNPMKRVKMFFQEPDYYIHGTADDDSLGRAASHGCIRMDEEDATELAQLVMAHGGQPRPLPWYRRIFKRRSTKVVLLSEPVPIEIR
jgi:lipoprotein-anchoring transpeptidase ErfK/SrfK